MDDPANYTPIQHLIDESLQPDTAPQVAQGTVSKEGEPAVLSDAEMQKNVETAPLQEVVEHTPQAEVKPFVQVRSETIELPPDLKKMGLKPATATSFPSYQSVTLPISDDQVYTGLQAPISSSFRWLAEICLFLLKRAHLTLVSIHGNVVRVVKKSKKSEV